MDSIHSQPIDHHADAGKRDSGKSDSGKPRLHEYFRAMSKEGASDLHLKADTTARLRLGTRIIPVKGNPLSGDEIAAMADEILDDRQRAFFAEIGSIDVAEELKGADRFRINIYRQRGNVSIAVRRVSREIPSGDGPANTEPMPT